MQIIGRAQWNAAAPKKPLQYVAAARRRYFVVHHSAGPVDQSVKEIQHWCISGRGFNDIDYNHLVRGDTGEIYEGRGWDAIGSHTANYNTVAVGVCVIGNDELSDKAKESVRWLYEKYCERAGRRLTAVGHKQLATTGTVCPGSHIFSWVHNGMPAPADKPATPVVVVAPPVAAQPVEGAVVEGESMSPEDMETLATMVADKVWAKHFVSASTEKRWPGAGEKTMAQFTVLGAMAAKDAVKAVGDLGRSITPVAGEPDGAESGSGTAVL